MSDEGGDRRLAVDGLDEVVEPCDLPVAFVDWTVDLREANEAVYLTLGTIDQAVRDEKGAAKVIVGAKLRMSLQFAKHLAGAIGGLPSLAPPTGGEPLPNPSLPKNMVN